MSRPMLALGLITFTACRLFAEDHAHGPGGHDHTTPAAGTGHHAGEAVVLGTKTIGAWQVTPTRLGTWVAGKDGPATVDLVPPKPGAKQVRVWIGTEDGKGSVKAKGETEAAHPGGWHCHIELPNPTPAGAQFWVAIESETGEQFKGAFPLIPATAEQPATAPAKAEHLHDHGTGGHHH